jgi:hypothetical protein
MAGAARLHSGAAAGPGWVPIDRREGRLDRVEGCLGPYRSERLVCGDPLQRTAGSQVCIRSRSVDPRPGFLKRPAHRPDLPPRDSDNEKRRLEPDPDPVRLQSLLQKAKYRGIARHKSAPRDFGILDDSGGSRSDATLCDRDAGFSPSDVATIPDLIRRGITAGLVGHNWRPGIPTIIWPVADNGWIFEGRITNRETAEYHGYPVRPSEAIASLVFKRFAKWAETNGTAADKRAAANCQVIYGL